MDSLKEWLIEVAVKKMGPSAIRGAILGISGWLITKGGFLAAYGVTTDAVAHTTTISWDKLSMALILGFPAVVAAVMKLVSHQATSLIPPLPSTTGTTSSDGKAPINMP